ncbi:MAG: ABC transporter ATP-binding protein [SAR324 cluster bacterium]|nr:ABC transporter ATP-binding protein [SAR324 cluster bacterium]
MMLKINKLAKYYGYRKLFSDVLVSLSPGQLVLLIGANGCGKSSLLKVLCGLSEFQRGVISKDDDTILGKRELRQMSYLFEHTPALFEELTVADNIRFFLSIWGKKFKLADWQDVLQDLGLINYLPVKCHLLSAGTRQKVGIVYSLMSDAPLMLLDEPFTVLDVSARHLLNKYLQLFLKNGRTLIMTAHHFDDNWPKIDQLWQIKNKSLQMMESPSSEVVREYLTSN